jgi:hypothetical protein
MKAPWLTLYGRTPIRRRRTLRYHLGNKLSFLRPELSRQLNANHPSGAGYTFGSGVVYKFLETNGMTHILRAHQLCMEGYASLFDNHLSTVWSAPNYCYRCGNSASILEVSPGGKMYFNVFEAAPENERDGPSQQAAQSAGGKVSLIPCLLPFWLRMPNPTSSPLAARIFFVAITYGHDLLHDR